MMTVCYGNVSIIVTCHIYTCSHKAYYMLYTQLLDCCASPIKK